MKKKIIIYLVILLFFSFYSLAVPNKVSIQGQGRDNNSVILTGEQNYTFQNWNSTHKLFEFNSTTILNDEGVFNVIIENITDIQDNMTKKLFINNIEQGNFSLTTVYYSFISEKAESLFPTNNYIMNRLIVNEINLTGNIYGINGTYNSIAWNKSSSDVYLSNSLYDVGIGTDNPNSKLEVIGTTKTTELNTSGINNSGNAYIGGKVGIGTNNPSVDLEVDTSKGIFKVGGTFPLQFVAAAGISPSIRIKSNEDVVTGFRLVNSVADWLPSIEVGTGNFVFLDAGNSKSPFTIEYNTPDNTLYLDDTGNVGIGTDAPAEKLTVIGNILMSGSEDDSTDKVSQLTSYHFDTDEERVAMLDATMAPGFNAARWGGGNINFNAVMQHDFYAAPDSTTLAGELRFRIQDANIISNPENYDVDHIFRGATAEIARFNAGTDTLDFPDDKAINFGTGQDISIDYDSGTTALNINLTGVANTDFNIETSGGANTLFVDGQNARVGIGTNAPTSKFQIGSSAGGSNYMYFDNNGFGSDYYSGAAQGASITFTRYGAGDGDAAGINARIFDYTAYSYNGAGPIQNALFSIRNDGAVNKGKILFSAYTGGVALGQLAVYSDEIVVNELGNDVDFRVEGAGQTNALFVQGSDGNVGVGTNTPQYPLEVWGNGTNNISIWAEGNISASGFNTRTPTFKNYQGNKLDRIKEPLLMLDSSGKIKRENLLEGEKGSIEYNTDKARPKYVNITYEECEDESFNLNCTNVTEQNIIYPYKKAENTTSVDGIAFNNRLLISELKLEIESLKLRISELETLEGVK